MQVANRGYRMSHIAKEDVDDHIAKEDVVTFGDAKALAWGWRSFKPKWLQWLNSPKWFLFFICWFTFVQGKRLGFFRGAQEKFHLPFP